MDGYFRRWWLGARLLINIAIAWILACLPITLGGILFRNAIREQSTLGIALLTLGVLYGIIALPAVFATAVVPLPADTPIRVNQQPSNPP